MARVLELEVPTLAVIDSCDPLMPPVERFRKADATMKAHVTVVVIKDAAHAINYSHPRELVALVRQFMDDQDVVGLPGDPTASRIARITNT